MRIIFLIFIIDVVGCSANSLRATKPAEPKQQYDIFVAPTIERMRGLQPEEAKAMWVAYATLYEKYGYEKDGSIERRFHATRTSGWLVRVLTVYHRGLHGETQIEPSMFGVKLDLDYQFLELLYGS